jgi:hypothetical protein
VAQPNRLVAYDEPTGSIAWDVPFKHAAGDGIPALLIGEIMTYRDPMGGTGTPQVSKSHILMTYHDGVAQFSSSGVLEWYTGTNLGFEQAVAGKPIQMQLGPKATGVIAYVAGACGCGLPFAFPSKDGKYMLAATPLGRIDQAVVVPSLFRDQAASGMYPYWTYSGWAAALPKCGYKNNTLLQSTIGYNQVLNGSNGYWIWGQSEKVVNCNSALFKDGVIYTGATNATAERVYFDIFGGTFTPAPPGSALPGYLWAYDAYTGQRLWKWDQSAVGLGLATPSAMLAWGEGNLYFGSYDGSVYCLDPTTAAVKWYREDMGAMAGTTCGPIYADGVLYVGGAPWRVYGNAHSYALNATTGETIWSYSTPGAMKHQGAVADGIWYVGTQEGMLYAFGAGPTKTTVGLSSAQLKAGDTVLISGQVLDQSPASPNAPVANAPVTLMYTPLGSVNIATIATVTTSYSGDYYYEWTVPNDLIGMNSIVVSFAGITGYKASSTTTNFRSGSAGLTQTEINQIIAAAPQPAAPTDYTPMFYAVIAIAAIAVVIGIVNTLFIRKLKK